MTAKDIYTLVEEAAAEIWTADGVAIFMEAPIPYFDGKTVDMVLSLGRGQDLLAYLDALGSGAFL